MSIPASGPISMSMFNTELGRSAAVANTRLANGETPGVQSIFYLAIQSSSNPPDQVAPHAFSELYGYTANLNTFVYPITLQQGDGFGNCLDTSTTYNASFTSNVPSNLQTFTENAGMTVYKVSGGGFLNSGSDISFGTVQTGVGCTI